MAIRTIVKHPDARLRQVAEPVSEMTTEIVALVDDMLETMRASGGLGLAAPQVGVSLRIFVLDNAWPLVFINPEIVERRGTTAEQYAEGCLSIPNFQRYVARSSEVLVRARDRWGGQFERRFYGLDAVAVQHELDHLNGVLMIDKGKPVQAHLPDPVWKSRSKKKRRHLTA